MSLKSILKLVSLIHSREIKTLLLSMENTWAVFIVLDRDSKPSCFQETLTNSTKYWKLREELRRQDLLLKKMLKGHNSGKISRA